MVSIYWAVAATVLANLPRAAWRHLDPRLPLKAMAGASGLVVLIAGWCLGVDGFLSFAARSADASNRWMLAQQADAAHAAAAALAPYGASVLTPLAFLLTPIGFASTYLVVTGAVRMLAGWMDDPRGDPVLACCYFSAAAVVVRVRVLLRRLARERKEGPNVPDTLEAGNWLGADVDYVLLSARRKPPAWRSGSTIVSRGDFFIIGAPVDVQTPDGLRTGYPLRRHATAEVIRAAIIHELPDSGDGARRSPSLVPRHTASKRHGVRASRADRRS